MQRVPVFFVLILFALPTPAVADEQLVVFYDPDANHQAINNIGTFFNRFLTEAGSPLRFQAVQSQSQLDELINSGRAQYAVVSAEYLARHGKGELKPLLVPSLKGDTHYRKRLVDRGDGDKGSLAGRKLAAVAPGGDGSVRVVEALKAAGVETKGALVIPVNKDVDALLALSFRQVDAALVTPSSMEVLRTLNPAAAATMRVVLETRPVLRSPFCVVGKNGTHLAEAVRQMSASATGRQVLAMLGADAWVSFDTKMLEAK